MYTYSDFMSINCVTISNNLTIGTSLVNFSAKYSFVKCQFGQTSVRPGVRSAKHPFGQASVRPSVRPAKCPISQVSGRPRGRKILPPMIFALKFFYTVTIRWCN